MIHSLAAISFGAAAGATLRWLLGLWLNAGPFAVPLGTLAANLFGSYLIGFAIGFFSSFPDMDPAWRLLVITGFLGSLTTFSGFSAEVSQQLQQGRLFWAGGTIALHVCGSLALTFLGMASFAWVKSIR